MVMHSIRAVTSKGFTALLDLLFPPHCVACGRWGAWLCEECLAQMPRHEPPVCSRCGLPLAGGGLCEACQQEGESPLQGMRSLTAHVAPLREAVQALKYEGMRVLAEPLSEELARYGERMLPRPQVIVPVPLHAERLRERGYNQSALLARGVGERWGVPVREDALQRTRYTHAQVGLAGAARRENVRGAFACPTAALRGQRVLLVDDVCTTGATLTECAYALREGGAATVWALTVTRAR